MGHMTRQAILRALQAMATGALARGIEIELTLAGGAAIVLQFNARESTKDVDAIATDSAQQTVVREIASGVAGQLGLPDDWLNDAVKGYLHGISVGEVVFESPGLRCRTLAIEQLPAMKLSAWRDDLDIRDARLLLSKIPGDRRQCLVERATARCAGAGIEGQSRL